MIQGIIDIGSNTVRMAIYEIDKDNLNMLIKKKHMVGLAGYLKDNMMQQDGIDKLCDILSEFKQFLEIFKIDDVIAFTTAALRNCDNSEEAVREIIERSGIDIKVISGDEEAEYDFIGSTHGLHENNGLIIDIGGGSTELVYYRENKIVKKISLELGSLAMRTKYVKGILPVRSEAEAIAAEAKKIIYGLKDFDLDEEITSICGIGGSFKGINALYNEIESNTGKSVPVAGIHRMIDRFSHGKLKNQEDAVIMMKAVPERLETVIPGMVIASILAERFGFDTVIYSDSGVREGFIYKEILKEY